MECFITDISRFSSTNVKICHLGSRLGTGHQIQVSNSSISRICLKFPNFLRLLRRLGTRGATHTFTSADNNLLLSHLW